MNRAMIDQDHTWWRVCLSTHDVRRREWGSGQGVKSNMFPTNTERKRLTGLSQQGRNMEGAEGVS